MYQKNAKQKAPKEDRRYDIILFFENSDDFSCYPNVEILEHTYDSVTFKEADGKIKVRYFDRARFHEVF